MSTKWWKKTSGRTCQPKWNGSIGLSDQTRPIRRFKRLSRIPRTTRSSVKLYAIPSCLIGHPLTALQLLSQNRRGQSQSALRAVQGRHEAIQKIERQMMELAQLFQDMEAAVIEQEPAIDETEQKTENTVVNLDQGNKHLDGAVIKARSARRKKWICFWIVGESIHAVPPTAGGVERLTVRSAYYCHHCRRRRGCGWNHEKELIVMSPACVFQRFHIAHPSSLSITSIGMLALSGSCAGPRSPARRYRL